MKFRFLLLLVSLLLASSAFADNSYFSARTDIDLNMCFEITSESTVKVVHGDIPRDYYTATAVPDEITYNGVTYRVTAIAADAFSHQERMTQLCLGRYVETIEGDAFFNSPRLTDFRVDDANNHFSHVYVSVLAASPFLYDKNKTTLVAASKKLKSFNSPYELNQSVVAFGDYAFSCCPITSINIPERITTIGTKAFHNCTALTSITVNAPNPADITLGEQAFYGVDKTNCVLHVPAGSLALYSEADQWKDFLNIQQDETIPVTTVGLIISGTRVTGFTSDLPSKVRIPDNITEIADHAFSRNTNLTHIVIPASVTKIGNYVFSGCTGLTSITIPNGVTSIGQYAFGVCTGLTSITIPNSVTSIGQSAFSGCTGLTSIIIPNGVTSIGQYAFQDCSGLTSITIGSSVTTISNEVFNGCTSLKNVVFEDGASSLLLGYNYYSSTFSTPGKGLFYDCPLESVYLGRNLQYTSGNNYGYSPFYNKTTLTQLTFGSNVTSIGQYAFHGCTGLTGSITIPAGVKSIGQYAFYGCSGLTGFLTIPVGVTSIGQYAFYGCSGLTGFLTIPVGVTSIGQYAFQGCSGLEKVNIGAGGIGNNAFYGCKGLEEVNIGAGVTSIGNYAFTGCSGLTGSLTIPDSVTSIGQYAFYGCSGLEEVNIGAGVTSVGNYAFQNCTSLLSVDIKGTITSINSNAWQNTAPVFKFRSLTPGMYGYNSCPLTVPHDAVEAYREAWPEYMVNIMDVALPIKYEINTTARADESDIVKKVLAVAQAWDRNLTDAMLQVAELKVVGTINSYDVMVLHNKAINLQKLDLSEATIVANSYEYYQGLKTANDVIGKYFIYRMKNLLEVKLPNSATSISENAIAECPNLKKVVIGNNTTSVGNYAFYGCASVKEFVIGENVKRLGERAFSCCSALSTLEIPASVETIAGGCFEVAGLKEIFTGESTKTIGAYAFQNCKQLQSLTVGDATTNIGDYFCYGCTNLKTVVLGKNVAVGSRAFENCSGLNSLTMGDNTTIGSYAFQGCTSLPEVTLPKNLKNLSAYAFSGCTSLKTVRFSPGLQSIEGYAFQNCTKLVAAMMPTTLKNIKSYAFSGCSGLQEVKIPASIESIGDYAFSGANIKNIYTWTIEPTNINQNTFPSGIFQSAQLHVPATANKLYYYDTQWSQFLRITNFFDPYEYFYLTNKDLIIDYETSRLQGLYDPETGIWKYSDADLGAGSGILVQGEEPQYLGTVRIVCDGKNSTAIIGGNSDRTESGANLNIDNLVIDMAITKNKWYFYCFPFDVDYDMMQYDGQFVWRYYDGAKRAANGSGGWTNVADGHLEAMKGYIFQGSTNGTLTITVPNVALDGTDKGPQIYTYESENSRNASWNLVGNPNIGYYAVNDIGYEAPITTYNGTTYQAYRPGDEDDNVTLNPYQAFFVQTYTVEDETEEVSPTFYNSDVMTRNQSLDPNFQHNIAQRRAKRHVARTNRLLVNLELSTDSVIDRTRVVFNDRKSMGYDMDSDAPKFMSNLVAQIYTLDSEYNQYAINERPADTYVVKVGITAPASGVYTIGASRQDIEMEIVDIKTGKSTPLAEGYTFTATKGTDEDRFIIRPLSNTSGIDNIDKDNNANNIDSDAEFIGINGVNYGKDAHRGVMIEKRGGNARKVYNR